MEDATTENPETLEQTEAPWPPQAIVTPADFRSVDYNSIVRDLSPHTTAGWRPNS